MSLHWQWTDKMGELELMDDMGEWKINIYQGNALMIMCSEKDEEYQLYNFFENKEHMKKCFGLTKGHENIAMDWRWKELKLNTRYKSVPDIVKIIAQAKLPIKITLY